MNATSAYVHVPFCRHRCGYCNFTVVANRDDLIDDYLRAISTELSWLGDPCPVDTLFLGGGTPTHLNPFQLRRLLRLVTQQFPLRPDAEFSVEANPEDLDQRTVDVLVDAGVNRVSLGVQSFHQSKLELLERAHQADVVQACLDLLSGRVRSVSIDLIFGIPEETTSSWEKDLALLIALQPQHVSTYGLTYEPGTQFFSRLKREELHRIEEDVERQMYEIAIETLTTAEYDHYEVSNFARPGFRCHHNENYWSCGEFFGIGPGASSYLGGVRRSHHRSTTTYLKKVLAGESPVVESESLNSRERAHERLVFGLRRLDGIEPDEFRAQTGFSVDEIAGEPLEWLSREGLLHVDSQVIRLTRRGLLVSDSIWPYLL